MGDISKNFSRREFACKCGCGFAAVDAELIDVLQKLRDMYAMPVTIDSACRCPSHNARIRGAEKSWHMYGMAVDFHIDGVKPADLAALLDDWFPGRYGIGEYAGWVHLDVRDKPARWKK